MLEITGSPITTSGTINIGFAGISGQYVNGAGGLTTFPTLISSIGLSMPSAFSVANSPLTANGTIAVTGAGVASQYIRGDGTLANFPTSGGGGGSVSYYLNGSVNQGTFVGNTYYEMSKVPVIGAGTDFIINANGYISQFRWTNSAVYSGNFAKPTSILQALPNTKLLLLFSSAGDLLKDSSALNKVVTNNSGVTWNSNKPF